jgi:hypothetical protein
MKYVCFFLSFLLAQSVLAQTKLPVIRATSGKVSINDGGYMDKNAWSLSPKARPDVFTADRTRKAKWVTFYTDIDSIKVKVKPGTRFNFIILLNNKDSCYTQVASAIPPENKNANGIATHDSIPFTLTAFNAIKVVAVINNTDTLNLHFDVSSFYFHLTRDAIPAKTRLLSNQPDAQAGKVKPNYNNLNRVFKIQMGNLILKDPEVTVTKIAAHEMDGSFGWNLFEGKQVELDYDHNLLIIHSRLPAVPRGYVKSKMDFARSLPYIKGAFVIAGKKHTGNFIMDTGSEQAVILNSDWVAKQNFPQDLKVIGSSFISDPRGAKYATKTVLSPLFKLNTFGLTSIPTLILSNNNPIGAEMNFLGNDVLKRFNMILDFKNDRVYLKPNKLTNVKYRGSS